MVAPREPLIFTDEPPAEPKSQPPEKDWSPGEWLELAKFADRGFAQVRELLRSPQELRGLGVLLSTFRGKQVTEQEYPSNGHTAPVERQAALPAPASPPRVAVNMEELMEEVDKALETLVSFKGRTRLEELPKMLRENRALVKEQVQGILSKCIGE